MSLLLLLWPLALIQRPEAESPLWARRSLILLISGLTFRYLQWRCTLPSYPHTTVWVLDDAGREEVRQLVRRLDCRYQHRLEWRHAEVGILNADLRRCHGELVAVLR